MALPVLPQPAPAGSRPGGDELEWDGVLDFLRTRVGLLDGVVFTGGEPTAQAGLGDAMREVRELGFRVALHTGGPVPARVARCCRCSTGSAST